MSEQLVNGDQQIAAADNDDGVHILDLLSVLARSKVLVISMVIIGGLSGLLISLWLPPVFMSTTKILPPQQQQNSGVAAVLGQLGGLAGAAGGIAGLKNPNDLYVGLLESRTVADNLIAKFKLMQRYQARTMDEARDVLVTKREIAIGKKDGMISITTSESDAAFAAQLANAYAEELATMTQTMALTEASQRRLFFEKQLREVKGQLADAEVALRGTQEKTGMIQPQAQVQAIISNVAQLKGTIAAKEVQLNAMRTFAAAQNPDLKRTQEELRSLNEQLSKSERSQSGSAGDFMVPTGKIPAVGVEYVRSVRNVKYYETMYELLAKQFELAKIDEAKDSGLIQILDKAIPAEQKSKPKRALITLWGLMGGAVLGILFAFAGAAYRRAREDPENQAHWQQLSRAWRNVQAPNTPR